MTTSVRRFQTSNVERFEQSGWCRIEPVRQLLAKQGTAPLTLLRRASKRWWARADELAAALEKAFAGFRFADEVDYGLLFVPSPRCLDTRLPIGPDVRVRQSPSLSADFFDERLTGGTDLVPPDADGAFFVTTVGRYALSAGSYIDVREAPEPDFQVSGYDTRIGMTRQLWGARVLQAGQEFLPDSEANDRWTFTVFAGDELCAGHAASGTVLKSKVRYRLGKPDRGIGSARVAPAVPLGAIG